LCSELLERLVTVDEPGNWDDFVTLCKKIDIKQRALHHHNKHQNIGRTIPARFTSAPTTSTTITPLTATGTYAETMDISAAH
jgi:hypothetical protein